MSPRARIIFCKPYPPTPPPPWSISRPRDTAGENPREGTGLSPLAPIGPDAVPAVSTHGDPVPCITPDDRNPEPEGPGVPEGLGVAPVAEEAGVAAAEQAAEQVAEQAAEQAAEQVIAERGAGQVANPDAAGQVPEPPAAPRPPLSPPPVVVRPAFQRPGTTHGSGQWPWIAAALAEQNRMQEEWQRWWAEQQAEMRRRQAELQSQLQAQLKALARQFRQGAVE